MIECAVFIRQDKVLVISDIHIGFEQSLNRQGVLVPRTSFDNTLKRIMTLIERTKPEKIVFNGDIKDDFATIGEQEWRNVKRLIDNIKPKAEIVFIKGNHDTMLEPIATARLIKIVKEYKTGNVTIMHGDVLPDKWQKTLILGHYHPAIRIREKAKSETYKCFLLSEYKNSRILLQPAFNNLSQGGDIRNHLPEFINPEKTNVYVVDKKILPFGRLKGLN